MLWHPDTFMPNAIASKNPMKQSISHRSLLRLQEHGRILYSRRISVVAECPMDLVLFPARIESYGYTADQVVYQWSKGQISALVLSKIRLPDFQIKEAYVVSQIESLCDRRLLQTLSDYSVNGCGNYFLGNTLVGERDRVSKTVMISIILAITFLIFSYNEMMPRVSYLKALDIWLAVGPRCVCFLIVFMSLIKLAIVKYMRQKLNSQKYRREASMVANILPIIRTNSVNNLVAPVENGSLSPTFTLIDQDNNNGTPMQPNHTPTPNLNRPFRSCSIQYTSVPLGELDDKKEHGVNLFSGFSSILPSFRFTAQTMRRFHWVTQMAFFFGFVIFAMLYFLLYPNVHQYAIDPACDRDKAEFFAVIS
ncbi:hypothetical protein M3Y97_00151600 [Aphelenchoides bicaudatus]|nr:hypothetical protein M3Y97_00151600 [Aphelenchoides bicaudatus]